MDRFIAQKNITKAPERLHLKSNMDRFIDQVIFNLKGLSEI